MTGSDAPKEEGDQHPSRPLSIGQRRVAASIGIAALGGGAVGSFLSGTNSIGIPALIATGAALTYVGITGQTLTRIKIGENEVGLAKQVVTNESAPENLRVKAAEVLEEADVPLARTTKQAVNEVLSNFQSSREYERAVLNTLSVTFPEWGIVGAPGTYPQWSIFFDSAGRRTSLAIDIKYVSEQYNNSVARRIRELRNRAYHADVRSIIVIVNVEIPQLTLNALQRDGDVKLTVITWRGPSDNPQLAAALAKAATHDLASE